MKTVVVNLFGGSGLGKSTTAAGLFYAMKMRGLNTELVREYVKQWAWDSIPVGKFDQIYLTGKQAKAESRLYNKLDYVVTDSPILLSAIYETFYSGKSVVLPSIKLFLDLAKQENVEHVNIFLARNKPFDTRGRYETQETAIKVDSFAKDFLTNNGVKFIELNVPDEERIASILKIIGVENYAVA